MAKPSMSVSVSIKSADSVGKAPKYGPEVVGLELEECVIVSKGTHHGLPSVDLVMKDENGKRYLVMTTGRVMEQLGGACQGVRELDCETG